MAAVNPLNTRAVRRSMRLFTASVWFLYLVLKPIYLLPKGLPQISDAVLLCGLIPAAMTMFLQAGRGISMVTLTGALFVGLTVAVNLVNYLFYPDTKFLLSVLYYPYNFLIFLFVVYLFRQDHKLMIRLSAAGIIISLFIQFISSEFFPDFDQGHDRLTGNFQNPNQLAYWALLSAAMLVFLRRNEKFGFPDMAALGLAGYIQTLALSKAGLICFGLFAAFLLFVPQMPKMAKLMTIFLLFAGASYLTFSAEKADFSAAERVTQRLQTIGLEADDSLAGRGYDRIAQNPEYIFAGAGEGAFDRFRSWGGPGELHSGLATMLFSYGILGLVLFGSFLFFIFHRQPWIYTGILLIVLLFSVTSQTIRFTHTWVFLGVAYGTALVRREEAGAGQDALPAGQALRA